MGDICSFTLCLPEQEGLDSRLPSEPSVSLLEPIPLSLIPPSTENLEDITKPVAQCLGSYLSFVNEIQVWNRAD